MATKMVAAWSADYHLLHNIHKKWLQWFKDTIVKFTDL